MLEILLPLIGIVTISVLLSLCIGCKERKCSADNNGCVIEIQEINRDCTNNATNLAQSKTAENISNQGSLGSNSSVRITITNVADNTRLLSKSSSDQPESPRRELPEIPTENGQAVGEGGGSGGDDDHEYDTVARILASPPTTVPAVPTLPRSTSGTNAEYDTLDALNSDYTTLPEIIKSVDYASVNPTVVEEQSTSNVNQNPDYHTIDNDDSSYDVLPEEMVERVAMRKCKTLGGRISPRPFSEGFLGLSRDDETEGKLIDKQSRSGSERIARDKEDSISVIYASINPDFRVKRDGEEVDEQKYSIVSTGENAPPVPENPYAQLDNLLEDLKIPNPDGEPKLKAPSQASLEHPYDDILSLRGQGGGSSREGGYSAAVGAAAVSSRKVNPVLSKSSPFAVSNTSRSSSISSPLTETKVSR